MLRLMEKRHTKEILITNSKQRQVKVACSRELDNRFQKNNCNYLYSRNLQLLLKNNNYLKLE